MSIDFHEFVCKITEVHWCRQTKVMYIYINLIDRYSVLITILTMYNLTKNAHFKPFRGAV